MLCPVTALDGTGILGGESLAAPSRQAVYGDTTQVTLRDGQQWKQPCSGAIGRQDSGAAVGV